MTSRRDTLRAAGAAMLAGAGMVAARTARAQDAAALLKWGGTQGYPEGWGGGFERDPLYRVANYSGGFERMLRHHVVRASPQAAPWLWRDAPVVDLRYRWGLFTRTPAEYMQAWPVTGLLISRGPDILLERHAFARNASMRMTSWSMAKSVTSLLLGICIDRGLIASFDDTADRYVPALAGTLHGAVSLRNLSNMCSGADVVHDRDNRTIYPVAFLGSDADIMRTVAGWNARREEQGRTYNYNELCPLTLGLVIRAVTGGTLSAFTQQALWQPLGAQGDATWTANVQWEEFNCIGFAATLRDWSRLGRMVADRGRVGDQQVVSQSWIDECTRWRTDERHMRMGVAMREYGYKAHMWHARADGSRLFFAGHHGQRVIVDMPTRTVLVQTAVEHEGNWRAELMALFDAATRL